MTLIVNYRDFEVGQRFNIHGADLTEPLGNLLRGHSGLRLVLERASFAGRFSDSEDNNDIPNCVLCLTDLKGNPATPILESSQDDATAAATTTTTETGLAMTLNEHAGRWMYVRTGTDAGEVRLISANTTGGQLTHAAVSTGLADNDEISILAAGPADASWDGRLTPVLPGWRLGNRSTFVGTADINDQGSGGSPTHTTTQVVVDFGRHPTGSLIGLTIEFLTGTQTGQTGVISANTNIGVGTGAYGLITFAAIGGAPADTDTYKITGDSVVLQLDHDLGEVVLPPDKGLGFFQMVEDNFSGALDYVQWTEMQIDIMGRIEAAGYQSGSRSSGLQPQGQT